MTVAGDGLSCAETLTDSSTAFSGVFFAYYSGLMNLSRKRGVLAVIGISFGSSSSVTFNSLESAVSSMNASSMARMRDWTGC